MAAFGLPNFGQLTEAFRKAQQIQQDAQKLQQELDEMELEGSNPDGRVRIWLSGNQQPVKVQIDASIIEEGNEMIEQATLEAMKNAYKISTETMKSRMEEITGGFNLNLPGMSDMN